MTKETYLKITQPFREHPQMAKGLHIANKCITLLMYASYPALIVYLFFTQDDALICAVLTPAISFVLLTLIRAKINRKRPYETFMMPPVIAKDTKGNSFPSRHVFSACIISMTFLLVSPWPYLGILLFVATLFLAIIRVLSGVHYPSDVAAGLLFGICAGFIGYIIL